MDVIWFTVSKNYANSLVLILWKCFIYFELGYNFQWLSLIVSNPSYAFKEYASSSYYVFFWGNWREKTYLSKDSKRKMTEKYCTSHVYRYIFIWEKRFVWEIHYESVNLVYARLILVIQTELEHHFSIRIADSCLRIIICPCFNATI